MLRALYEGDLRSDIEIVAVNDLGDANTKSAPKDAQAIARLDATLFPSPTKATRSPSKLPMCSCIVSMSAMAWHGCSRSDSAFTTGMDVYSERISRLRWEYTLAMMPSTKDYQMPSPVLEEAKSRAAISESKVEWV